MRWRGAAVAADRRSDDRRRAAAALAGAGGAAGAAAAPVQPGGVPARHDRVRAGQVPGAGVPAAEHRRLPPANDAGRAEEHPVPKAKFPVDRHPQPPADADHAGRHRAHDRRSWTQLNLRVLVNLSGGSGASGLQRGSSVIRASKYPDRIACSSPTSTSHDVGPGLGEKAVGAARGRRQGRRHRRRRRSARTSACGTRRPTARGSSVDDPELDPVWAACAPSEHSGLHPHRRAAGVLRAARHHNERWLELALFARSPLSPTGPGPALRGADGRARPHVHAASEDDVHRRALRLARQRPRRGSAKLLDALPNLYPKSARCSTTSAASRARRTILRQVPGPRAVRQGQLPARRVSRTTGACSRPTDEYFDYYRDYHAFWKLYGMDLPDAVLKKLYYQNALRVVPGLPQTAGLSRSCHDTAKHGVDVPRHRRRRLHRLASRRGTAAARPPRPHRRRFLDRPPRATCAHLPARRARRRRPRRPDVARTRRRRAATTSSTRRRFRRCRGRSRIRSRRTAPTSTAP